MTDVGYILTRRQGRRVIVSRQVSSVVDPATGERRETRSTLAALAVVEPTSYARKISARECQEEVGPTTILLRARDCPFDRLTPADAIIVGDQRYNIVTSTLEDSVLRITAREQGWP
ncbi:hypothetical protein [Lacipirellula sp.]|uniref:hypothetical protein n=1 Tax=Lacipirellula sp. TaxID=2691419 RepID=UPI003D11D4DC